MKPYRIKQS